MSTESSAKPKLYRMPTAFGPAIGPRQAPEGMAFDSGTSPEKLCAYISFRTQGELLEGILPDGFALRGTPAVTFEFSYLTGIDWLAGRGYNMLTMRIPVSYRHEDALVEGYFQPVVWENLTEPIISGREELGWSKIFADLPPPDESADRMVFRAEWMGFKFLELCLSDFRPADSSGLNTSPVLHRKYIPATQAWGTADVDYVTMTPAGGGRARLVKAASAQARLSVFQPRWEDMPTQHACVSFLAALPILEYTAAGMYSTVGGKDLSDQVRFYRP